MSSAQLNENENNVNQDHLIVPIGFEKNKKRSPKQLEEIWQNMRDIPNNTKCLYILLIISALGSLALIIMGSVLHAKSSSYLSKLLISFGSVALFTFLYGIFAVYKYNQKAEEFLQNSENVNPEDIDQSLERNLLNIFMFLIMLLFIIFAIVALGSITGQQRILFEIKAISVKENTWKTYFGNATVSVIIGRFETICMTTAALSFMYLFLIGVIIFMVFDMLGFYRAVQTCVQFISLLFFTLGFILLYFTIYAIRYSEITASERAFPTWLPVILLICSIICLFIAIVGFIGAYLEKKDMLWIFFWSNIGFKILLIVLCILFFVFADKFKDIFQNNCYSLMDLVEEDYLKEHIGCARKYEFTNTHLQDLICPKPRIALHWEIQTEKREYGCLEKACCYNFYSYLQSNLDLVAVTALILFVSSCLLSVGSYIMYDRLESGDEIGSSTKDTVRGVGIFAIIVIILFIILICFIPSAPKQNPSKSIVIEETPRNNTVISKNEISDNQLSNETKKEEIKEKEQSKKQEEIQKDMTIIEDKQACTGECLALKYIYLVISKDGDISPNEKFNKTNVTLVSTNKDLNAYNDASYVKFTSFHAIENFLSLLDFNAPCELDDSKITIHVTATPFVVSKIQTNSNSTSFIKKKKSNLFIKSKGFLKQSENDTNQEEFIAANQTDENSNNRTGKTNESLDQTPTATEQVVHQHEYNETIEYKIIDFSKLKEGETITIVNNRIIDYSLIEKETVFIHGRVIDENNNIIPNAKITYDPVDFKSCSKISLFSDKNDGEFETNPINLFENNYKLKYSINITKEGYIPFTSYVYIGGYAYSNINLGDITLFKTKKNEQTEKESTTNNTVSNETQTDDIDHTTNDTSKDESNTQKPIEIDILTRILNAQDNTPLPNTLVKVYFGYKEVPQEVITLEAKEEYQEQTKKEQGTSSSSTSSDSFDFIKLNSKVKKNLATSLLSLRTKDFTVDDTEESKKENESQLVAEVKTNENGVYHVILTKQGLYTFIYTKDNFHRGIVSKF